MRLMARQLVACHVVVLISTEIRIMQSRRSFLQAAGVLVVSSLLPVKGLTADCSQWYGKGYCTDYVAKRTGKRQGGDAKNWSGNVKDKSTIRSGDVVIFDFGHWGHVAVVDQVHYRQVGKAQVADSVRISEWNWADPLDACARGPNFGKLTTPQRTVSLQSVSRVWRP
jgi:surface antigen